MDFRFSAEEEAFRQEVADFVGQELPWDWKTIDIDAEILLPATAMFLGGRVLPDILPQKMAKRFKVLPVGRRRQLRLAGVHRGKCLHRELTKVWEHHRCRL